MNKNRNFLGQCEQNCDFKVNFFFSLLSLVAELGGYMSLFLGVSCMNLYSILARMWIKINDKMICPKEIQNVKIVNSSKVVAKK